MARHTLTVVSSYALLKRAHVSQNEITASAGMLLGVLSFGAIIGTVDRTDAYIDSATKAKETSKHQ